MTPAQTDIYDPDGYRKHKQPDGWGSLCPPLELDVARALFASGVRVENHVYNVDGEFAYRALQHRPGLWHGHPIPWSRLPSEARKLLIESGRLTQTQFRKAVRKGLGQEFA